MTGKTGVFIQNQNGVYRKEHYLNGDLHNDNGPAIKVIGEGIEEEYYYFHGELHNDNGPAIYRRSPTSVEILCYVHGRLHSNEETTVTYWSEREIKMERYKNGMLHNNKGYASLIICFDEKGQIDQYRKEYRQFGLLHNENGAAKITKNRYGVSYEYYSFGKRHRGNDKPALIQRNYVNANIVVPFKKKLVWYVNDEIHRIGRPALIEIGLLGKKIEHVQHGKLHNSRGPARVVKNGCHKTIVFCQDGLFHRDDDKPSYIEIGNGRKIWKYYKKNLLHRDNGPAVIIEDQFYTLREHYQFGLLHNDNDYAYTRSSNEYVENAWYTNGKIYRPNGLGHVIIANGAIIYQIYFLNGKQVSKYTYDYETKKMATSAFLRGLYVAMFN